VQSHRDCTLSNAIKRTECDLFSKGGMLNILCRYRRVRVRWRSTSRI